jgi:hypothetical protein
MKKFISYRCLRTWHFLGLYRLLPLFILFIGQRAFAQCTGTVLAPNTAVIASSFNDTIIVSNKSMAGQYFLVKNLALNKSYLFISSRAGDYFTIRNVYSNAVLGHGPAPYSYAVGSGPDLIYVHINLQSPPCGSDAIFRTIKIVCTTCTKEPAKVGVNTTDPQASLDIAGEIKLGNTNRPAEAGMVRWNNDTKDFEGYNGMEWISLTKSNAATGHWGQISAANIIENTKLLASDGAIGDDFGYSVSISGDYAIIGAPYDDIGVNGDQGSVYIFLRNGTAWAQQAKLIASDGAANDFFGYSVSISGDYAFVGAVFDDVGANMNQGSAYIFIRNGIGWTQQAKLTASDGAEVGLFGYSVSISGDYAIVGAKYDDVGANTQQGSAYIFFRTGTAWAQQAKLNASDGASSDYFGHSVSISGDYVIVGTTNDDVGGNTDQGSAYTFLRSGTAWTQQAKLIASDGAISDYFGSSVSISGDYAIVGAKTDDVGSNTDQGSAYIFIRLGLSWTQQAKLTASDGAADDYFGYSVSISGNYAIVGALYSDVGVFPNQGSAYIYIRNGTTWVQQAKLNTSDGDSNDYFGHSVSISGNYAIVGARNDDIGANSDQGSVYIILKN